MADANAVDARETDMFSGLAPSFCFLGIARLETAGQVVLDTGMWGAGALIGPVFAGAAMQGLTHGLPLFVALACTCFMWAALKSPAQDIKASE